MAFRGQPTPSELKRIRRAKISDGKGIVVTVPSDTSVQAQTFVELDGFFGVAMESVTTAVGEEVEIGLNIEQAEYETDQINTLDAIEKGDKLYWDGSVLTKTDTGNRLVARATSEKDSNNVISLILLPQQ